MKILYITLTLHYTVKFRMPFKLPLPLLLISTDLKVRFYAAIIVRRASKYGRTINHSVLGLCGSTSGTEESERRNSFSTFAKMWVPHHAHLSLPSLTWRPSVNSTTPLTLNSYRLLLLLQD